MRRTPNDAWLNETKTREFYVGKPTCAGDVWARELFDHYMSQRKKILNYSGKSAVNVEAFCFYEINLIDNTRHFWWHWADKKYIDTVLWFLRRLKVDITQDDEVELFRQFYMRLPYHRRFGLNYDKEFMAELKNRWGVNNIPIEGGSLTSTVISDRY